VLPIGTANDLYYETLGVAERKRHLAPYTVDNAFFRERRVARAAARRELGLGEDELVVLYVGKLIAHKAPATVIEACARLPHRIRVLVAGDGPLRVDMQAAAGRRVPLTVLGFLNQTELPLAYGAADVLALPSLEEPWGLVVNEAMCNGLPVVASTRVGARLDLVAPGVTGAVFRAGDADDLARALEPLLSSGETRRWRGEAALRRMDDWDLGHTVEGMVRAVQAHV
jgi:glycosyltransferase involved in cell wall biosynthesis